MLTTLFEMTTQHGFIGQVLHNIFRIEKRQPKHFELEFIAVRKTDTEPQKRYLRVFYKPRPSDKPVFTYLIRERGQMESTEMWRRTVEKELVGIWKKHFGQPTSEESDSQTSPPTASSTDAQPALETSPSEPEAAAPESTESGPSPQSEAPLTPKEASSKPSKRPYKRKAKSSRS